MFIVRNATGVHWLKGSIWTSELSTATRYETTEAAQAALDKSKKFNPKGAKRATIVEDVAQ